MNFSGFKSGYPLALRSAASIVAFWFLLFISLSVIRSLGAPFVSAIGLLNDATTPVLATTVLQLGLGGTVVGTSTVGETTGTFTLAFLLLIVPIGLFYLMRSLSRRYPASAITAVQSGAYSASGAVLAVAGLAFLSSGETVISSTSASVGFAWIVPAVVAAVIGFSAAPGAIQSSIAGRLSVAAKAFNRAFRGLSKFLVVVAVASSCYSALSMGTGLQVSAQLWIWPLAALTFALVLPTLSALLTPLFLGALVSYTGSALTALTPQAATNPLAALRETDYAWVSWLILGTAWLSVIIAAVRNGYRSPSNKSAWIHLPVVNVVVALLLTWLGSFRISGSASAFSFLQAAPSFGNEGFTTVAVFAMAGLLYGALAHPFMRPLVSFLFEVVGKPFSNVIKGLVFAFSLRWIAPLNRLWNAISAQKFILRKSIKYSLVFSLVGISFLLGAPLVSATAPLYDSENFADKPLVSALRSGDVAQLNKIVSIEGKTFLGSGGLGETEAINIVDPQDLAYDKAVAEAAKKHTSDEKAAGKPVAETKVERPAEENLRNITWGEKGKYFLNLKYSRSSSKAPFLTVVPQWDVAIVSSALPKLTLTNGKFTLSSIQVGKKAYQVSDVIILPGLAEVSAGVDSTNFLASSKVMVDTAKDAKADVKISLNASKSKEIFDYTSNAMRTQFTDCKSLTFKGSGSPSLAAVDYVTGLPGFVVKGSGVCDSTSSGTLPYNVVATAVYSVDENKWIFTYKF
jgi:hypothetical protein